MDRNKIERLEQSVRELEYRTSKLEETVKFVMKAAEPLIVMHADEFQDAGETSRKKVKVVKKTEG